MKVSRIVGLVALLIAALSVAACGAASSPSPAASTSASAAAAASPSASEGEASASASAAASESAEPSASAEETASPDASEGEASGEPSGAIPGFSFPSEAAELEALLPEELCGETAIKFSFAGDTFEQNADEEFRQLLEGLGRSPEDVSMAVAGTGGTSGETCGAGIFRIEGTSADQLREVFTQTAEQQGDVVEESSIGGRQVFEVTSDGDTQYIYFAGDAMIFVSGPEDQVEGILSELP